MPIHQHAVSSLTHGDVKQEAHMISATTLMPEQTMTGQSKQKQTTAMQAVAGASGRACHDF